MGTTNPDPPPDPAGDPTQDLLDEADCVLAWAMVVYGGPRVLTREQAMWLFLERRQARVLLAHAATVARAHNYGPRAPLGDVERRVQAMVLACTKAAGWACRNRGLAPPALPKDEEPPELCPWPAATVRAEVERIALWREVQSARVGVSMLLTLAPAEPTSGPIPPDRFRWREKEVRGLTGLEYKFLATLCRGGELREPVPITEVTGAVYGIDPSNKAAVEKRRRALKQVRERAEKKVNAAGVRIWVEQTKSHLCLKSIKE